MLVVKDMKDQEEKYVRDVVTYNWFCGGWKSKIYLDKLTKQVNFTERAGTCSGWHGWWDYQWSKETEGIWTIVFHKKGFEDMAIQHVLHQDSKDGEVYHTWWREAKKGGGADVVMWRSTIKTPDEI